MNEETNADSLGDDPVTVLVTRRPLAGKQAEFEQYLAGITKAASSQPGHLGSTIFQPDQGADSAYRILFRFARRSDLDRWEASEERARWRSVAEQVSQPREVQQESGLEAWFTIGNCDKPAHPAKFRQAMVVWLGIYLIVTLLSLVLLPWIAHWPMVPRLLLFTGVVVVLMTWVVMPRFSKWFAWWLHPCENK